MQVQDWKLVLRLRENILYEVSNCKSVKSTMCKVQNKNEKLTTASKQLPKMDITQNANENVKLVSNGLCAGCKNLQDLPCR